MPYHDHQTYTQPAVRECLLAARESAFVKGKKERQTSKKGRNMATTPGYIIVDLIIDDLETFKKYQKEVVPVVKHFGGRYLIKGGEKTLTETDLDWKPNRIVVIQFPSMTQARAFYDSEMYAAVKGLRTSSSRATLAFVEGFDG